MFCQDSAQEEDGDSEEIRLVRAENGNTADEGPHWLPLVDQFKYESSKINDNIESLRELMLHRTSALFDQDEDQSKQEIEIKSHEITQKFNGLHALVLELKNIATRNPSTKVLRNILQWQFREVACLSERLRSYQREHLSRLNEKEKYMEQFVINFDDVDCCDPNFSQQQIRFPEDDRLAHSDSSIGFENRNYQTQEQLEVDYVDNDLIRERDAEMTKVMKSIVELNQIFQEMTAMVVNQGTLMDRIDYNMETVHMKVQEGAIQLSRAERSAARTRKLKCIFILCGSVFLALLIMILQS